MPKKNGDIDIEKICQMYLNGNSLETICNEVHLGKLRVKQILLDNNIIIKKKGAQVKYTDLVVNDWKIKKYEDTDDYHYVAKVKDTGEIIDDAYNQGGHLTTYIEQHYGVETPTLYDRRVYYMKTGNYWWEQWFDIIKEPRKNVKKCPYCDWTTEDVENRSGAFVKHLKQKHGLTQFEYIQRFPDDKPYFELSNKTLNLQMEENPDKYTVCKVCGKKLLVVGYKHLATHNMTVMDYITKFGVNRFSSETLERYKTLATKMNLSLDKNASRYSSSYEAEIASFLKGNNICCQKDHKILGGQELDLVNYESKIAIEFNGLQWHTEWFGKKDKMYHLSKTIECAKKGYKLIHIFEDEWVNRNDIVKNKLLHLFHAEGNKTKIMGRKCLVKEISRPVADTFLMENHIQGGCFSSINLGAYYNNNLVGVMCFTKEKDNNFCLTRFATDYNFICQGVGGKLFNYFVKKYQPKTIKSFADRRWTCNTNDNIYTRLNFCFDGFVKPDYHYYNPKISRLERIHKFNLRKQKLHKKYGFPLEMTETEMVKQLGYDRIWDCGLIRYVWKDDKKG